MKAFSGLHMRAKCGSVVMRPTERVSQYLWIKVPFPCYVGLHMEPKRGSYKPTLEGFRDRGNFHAIPYGLMISVPYLCQVSRPTDRERHTFDCSAAVLRTDMNNQSTKQSQIYTQEHVARLKTCKPVRT